MVRVCGVGAEGLEQAVQAPCPPGLPPTEQASATPAQAAESPASTQLTSLLPPPCHIQHHHRPQGKPLRGVRLRGLAGSGGRLHPPAHRPRPKGWKPGHHPSVPKGCGEGDLPCSGCWVQSEPLGGFWSLASGWEEPARPLWDPGVWEGGSGKNRAHCHRAGGLGGPWDATTIPPSRGPRAQKRLWQTHGRTVVIFDGALLT